MKPTKLTAPELAARKRAGPKIVTITAYDATMARLLDEAGVDILLVGDSLGMVVQGLPNTLSVTVEEICYHGRAVARGAERAHLVGDMPFMSYQASRALAVKNAGRLIKEGTFEAVKLEGGEVVAEQVARIVGAGIPVMGHLGLTPQSVHKMGGFRVQGRSDAQAAALLDDARVLEQAGVYALVLEGIPAELGRRITAEVSVPTIGIGAGPHCDGQVLVCYDLLGMYRAHKPKFVKEYARLGDAILEAAQAFAGEVRSGAFPAEAHSFLSGSSERGESSGTKPVVAASKPPSGYGPRGDEGA